MIMIVMIIILIIIKIMMIIVITIMITQKKERNKTQERQVLHKTISHHPLTNAQLVLEQHLAHASQLLPVYILGMTFHGMDIPLASSSQQPWLCFSTASCTPAHWQSTGNFKVLG